MTNLAAEQPSPCATPVALRALIESRRAVRRFTVTPEDAGLARHDISAIRGGDADENANALRALLDAQ